MTSPALAPAPVKRPARLSLANWPVGWKVLAIALVPLLLAAVFGGLRVYASAAQAGDLRTAAKRVELLAPINDYLAALENALMTSSAAGDTAAAMAGFDAQHAALERRLEGTHPVAEVRLAVTTLLDHGKALLVGATANEIDLRQQVTTYVPLLLTAETAITGSVRLNDEQSLVQAEGLSRAVASRGQMTMQRMLVEGGGDLPEPELRSSMIALAGSEPNTVTGMSRVLGGTSEEAATLRSQMVQRSSLLSDPAATLVDNPDLLASIQTTGQIAQKLISDTTASITTTVDAEANHQRNNAIRDALIIVAVFVIALGIVLLVARSLVRPLRVLRDGALRIAHQDLARGIDRVKAGDEREPAPLPIHTTEEVGQVAHAVDELHAQALMLAGDEARLRVMVDDMFETMSRRNKSLVDQQLSLIDGLERNEEDPVRLDSLFRLDHLATRMRRNGANLLVLAGAQTAQGRSAPVPLATLINAAASEVEEYRRVEVGAVPECAVLGSAATDSVHLLAELLDNALRYSPPAEPVRVRAVSTTNGGVLVEVDDSGLGMTDSDLRIANMRLTAGGEVNPESARHMGLFVAGRLARQHDMTVRLLSGDDGVGTTAQFYLPPELLDGAAGHPEPQPWRAPDPVPVPEHAETVVIEDDFGLAPVSALPHRDPGSSGIAGVMSGSPFEEPGSGEGLVDSPWLAQEDRAATPAAPTNTAEFFSSRGRLREAAVPAPPPGEPDPEARAEETSPHGTRAGVDLIYQNMVSEWLVDPHDLAVPQDWKSVWDQGWAAAAEAEDKPVTAHTDHGLPVREPGARLVPGAAVEEKRVASGGDSEPVADAGEREAPDRDPDAIRASISSHFEGVLAARSHAGDDRLGHEE